MCYKQAAKNEERGKRESKLDSLQIICRNFLNSFPGLYQHAQAAERDPHTQRERGTATKNLQQFVAKSCLWFAACTCNHMMLYTCPAPAFHPFSKPCFCLLFEPPVCAAIKLCNTLLRYPAHRVYYIFVAKSVWQPPSLSPPFLIDFHVHFQLQFAFSHNAKSC